MISSGTHRDVTKDPGDVGLSIPTELQWLGSLLASGFGLWKFYLNPLKEKVYSFDREIGETKAEVHHVRDNTNRIEQDLESIKETMLKIANSMTPKKK